MRSTIETQIAAPAEVVFAILTDYQRLPEVVTSIDSIEILTNGPAGIGTRIRETRELFGQSATEVMTVTEFDRPHRLVLSAFNHGTAYTSVYGLRPIGSTVALGFSFEGHPRSFLARVLVPLAYVMKGTIRKQLTADLADIKRAAERQSGSTAEQIRN